MVKANFPFTDYDFYGYLASGLTFLFFVDLFLNSGNLFSSTKMTFIGGTLILASSYFFGHIIAAPSQAILENLILQKMMIKPTDIILGRKKSGLITKFYSFLFVGHEYSSFSEPSSKEILESVSSKIGKDTKDLSQSEIFDVTYQTARQNEYSQDRLSKFLNLYGFCRNMSMTFIISSILVLFAGKGIPKTTIILVLLLLAILMFFRFVKFYSAYMREIFRGYQTSINGIKKS